MKKRTSKNEIQNRKKTKAGGEKKTVKKSHAALVLVALFIAGLALLLYPVVSDWWNSYHQSRAVLAYAETISNLNEEEYAALWDNAVAYNRELAQTGTRWVMSEEEQEKYENTLRVTDSGIMAYIDIPKINCTLPIYHGTDESVLQTAVGHLSGTSLPVGGEDSHCVISGHRGLPSAKLFTDLDKMTEGDEFSIRTLDEVLTYEVDQILIVEPSDLSALGIEKGEDYCTLVTCTPYGINTHRMLVRGHRVDTVNASSVKVTADALQVNEILVALVIAVPMLIILIVIMLVLTGRKQSGGKSGATSIKHKKLMDRILKKDKAGKKEQP